MSVGPNRSCFSTLSFNLCSYLSSFHLFFWLSLLHWAYHCQTMKGLQISGMQRVKVHRVSWHVVQVMSLTQTMACMQQVREAYRWSEESLHEMETDMIPERSPSNVDEFIFNCAPAQQKNNSQTQKTIINILNIYSSYFIFATLKHQSINWWCQTSGY